MIADTLPRNEALYRSVSDEHRKHLVLLQAGNPHRICPFFEMTAS